MHRPSPQRSTVEDAEQNQTKDQEKNVSPFPERSSVEDAGQNPKEKNHQKKFARNSPNGYGRVIHRNDREIMVQQNQRKREKEKTKRTRANELDPK